MPARKRAWYIAGVGGGMVLMESGKQRLSQTAIELFLLSLVSLYIELLVIRWMSADIRAFTVFRTFPLVTCFIGLGVGFALGKDKIFRLTPYAILAFVFMMLAVDRLGWGLLAFPTISVYQWQNLTPNIEPSFKALGLFMIGLILLLAAPFAVCACIGSRLGVLFNEMEPLRAYAVNIGGAIAGSIAFVVLSYMGLAPWQLLVPACVVILYYLFQAQKDWKPVAALAVIPVIYLVMPMFFQTMSKPQLAGFIEGPVSTYWSPYQRVDVVQFTDPGVDANEFVGLELGVNHVFYQYFFSDSIKVDQVNPYLATLLHERRREYSMPFTLTKPDDVLIVGAGTGQNVGSALALGAKHVDAVDIDPVILQLGRRYNPAYKSPNVNLVCDDARHFFSVAPRKYDVVVFTFLDSHTVAGRGASVRIDTYVYTKESVEQALKLLKPGGVLVIAYAACAPWIPQRLYHTIQQAAGYEPLVLVDTEAKSMGTYGLFYMLGDAVKSGTLPIPQGWAKLAAPDLQEKTPRIVTDDWPYLYVDPTTVDTSFLLVLAEVLGISVFAGRKFLFGESNSGLWQMFFLGAAFLLMELHAISLLSLLYGSTWLTSAIVINGILIMIFAANAFVLKFGKLLLHWQPAVYAALVGSLVVSFMLPVNTILETLPRLPACLLITTVVLIPIALAGVIFACAFSRTTNPSRALAYNLFGAVIGGILEYLSNYTGIRSLELLAAALYIASFVCFMRSSTKAVYG